MFNNSCFFKVINTYYNIKQYFLDYTPFGMRMSERSFNSSEYKYGFQGQEKDDELKGEGNSYDFGARMFDPRIARFIAVDPKWREFQFQSTYAYALNNPIRFIDEYGEGPKDRIKAARKYKGTAYKQQTNIKLRTGMDSKALEFMDCSELVCRVLAYDEFTNGVESMPTWDIMTWMEDNWKETPTPKAGDIIVWNGHTAVVSKDYDEKEGKLHVIHATKYDEVDGVVEEKYSLSYYKKKDAKFYTPKIDMPDEVAVVPPTKPLNQEQKSVSSNEEVGFLQGIVNKIVDSINTLASVKDRNMKNDEKDDVQ